MIFLLRVYKMLMKKNLICDYLLYEILQYCETGIEEFLQNGFSDMGVRLYYFFISKPFFPKKVF